MSLTSKQHAFVIAYVENIASPKKESNTQIAINAGYAEKSAPSIACDNLKNPKIMNAINEMLDTQGMSANEVLFHFSKIARGEITDSTLGDRIRCLENLAKYHNLTNTTQIKTWKDDAVIAIKNGEIDYQGFMKMFDDESLAHQLFMQAGVPIGE